jgi:hypothetical protein
MADPVPRKAADARTAGRAGSPSQEDRRTRHAKKRASGHPGLVHEKLGATKPGSRCPVAVGPPFLCDGGGYGVTIASRSIRPSHRRLVSRKGAAGAG